MVKESNGVRSGTIGEIFVRAFVLLRNDFWAVYGLVVIFTLPFTLLQAATFDVLGAALAAVGQHPGPDAFEKIGRALAPHHRDVLLAIVVPFVAAIASEVALAAIAVRISARLRGLHDTLATNVQVAFARFGAIVAIAVAAAGALIVVTALAVGAIVALATIALGAAMIVPAARPVVAVLLGGFSAALIVGLSLLTVLAARIAIVIAAAENPNPAAAIGFALRRLFTHGAFRRTLQIPIAIAAVYGAQLIVVLLVAATVSAARGPDLAGAALAGLAGEVAVALVDVALVLYAFEARARLVAALAPEAAPAVAPPAASVAALPPVRRRAPAGDLDADDHARIDDYIARRATLIAGERTALAASIAAPLRPKLFANFAYLDDDALLEFLAETEAPPGR